MKRIIPILIALSMIAMSIFPASTYDDPVKAHIGSTHTEGTWSAFPFDHIYHFNSTDINYSGTIDNPVGPGAGAAGWDNAVLNATAGTRISPIFTPPIQSTYTFDTGSHTYNGRRPFIRWDLSGLPVGGTIKNISMNITWTGYGPDGIVNYPTYIIIGNYSVQAPNGAPGYGPDYPLTLADYGLRYYTYTPYYTPLSQLVANNNYGTGAAELTHYYFNQTGKNLIGSLGNCTNSSIYCTMVILNTYELHRSTPIGYHGGTGLTTTAANIEMTVVISGGIDRLTGGGGDGWSYEDFDPGWITGMLGTLLWFIGLGGMVIIPMMIYAKTRESGDIGERFNKSVMLVGMFIVCLALFFWAIS